MVLMVCILDVTRACFKSGVYNGLLCFYCYWLYSGCVVFAMVLYGCLYSFYIGSTMDLRIQLNSS